MKFLILLLLSFNLYAQDKSKEQPRYMKACENKKVNDPCTFTSKKNGNVVNDTCRDATTPKGKKVLTCGIIKQPLTKQIKAFFK